MPRHSPVPGYDGVPQDQGARPTCLARFKAHSPNACWLSDITYIPTREGWLYLAAVLDSVFAPDRGLGDGPTLDGQLARMP